MKNFIPYIAILLITISCEKHEQIYKGKWGVEIIEINGKNILNKEILKNSIFQSGVTFSKYFGTKKILINNDTILLEECEFSFIGPDSIKMKNCSNSKLDNIYSIDIKEIYKSKSGSKYSMIMKNDNSYFKLVQKNIDLSFGIGK